MSNKYEADQTTERDFGEEYKPDKVVKVVKKDGSLEAFNVQKVIDAVGKSAYRALTKCRECAGGCKTNRSQKLSRLSELQTGLCAHDG